MKCTCHIAQVNIGRVHAPMTDARMQGFVDLLDKVNALAESSPGFVWRLKTEDGNATSLQPYDDERILINLSVWKSPEQLKDFVYRGLHAQALRRRKEWFERFDSAWLALWWVAPDHTPTIQEAKERLAYLQMYGESDFAFGFSRIFPAPKNRCLEAALPQQLENARETT